MTQRVENIHNKARDNVSIDIAYCCFIIVKAIDLVNTAINAQLPGRGKTDIAD